MGLLRYAILAGVWSMVVSATPLTVHDNKVRESIGEAVVTFLSQYSRPITMLDFDPQDTFYSCAMAYNFDATCVMISNDSHNSLLQECNAHSDVSSLILLKNKPTATSLQRLSECEHFDCVLALHGVDSFSDKWRSGIDHIFNCGDNCMILLPLTASAEYAQELVDNMRSYVETKQAKLLKTIATGDQESWGLFLHSHQKPFGGRVHWKRKKLLPAGTYRIESNFYEKKLYKPTTKKWTPWQRGINLRTFIGLHGAYPTKAMVLKQLKSFKGTKHNDLTPCNIVMQGKKIIIIDFNDPRRHLDPKVGFERLMTVFERA